MVRVRVPEDHKPEKNSVILFTNYDPVAEGPVFIHAHSTETFDVEENDRVTRLIRQGFLEKVRGSAPKPEEKPEEPEQKPEEKPEDAPKRPSNVQKAKGK